MVLFTNGDSWTQGDHPAQDINWEAKKTLNWYDIVPYFGQLYKYYDNNRVIPTQETRILYKFYDSPVWPKVLGDQLGMETWNAGRLGDDNYGIYSSTIQSIEWLKSKGKTDIFAIIGWTSKTRIPIYLLDEESGEVRVKQQRPDKYTLANELYQRHNHIQNEFLLYVFNLQNYFKLNNIKYLMFNAFDEFEDFDQQFLSNSIDTSKWVNSNVTEAHFKQYIVSKFNLKGWSSGEPYFRTNHPTDISHIEWGKFLYTYLENNDLVY